MNSPTPSPTPAGDREAVANAARRSERRGTPNPKVSAQAVREALAQAKSRTHFARILQERGIEADFDRRGQNQEIYGWRLRAAGAEEWLKASTLAKDLSWPKIGHRFAEDQESQAPVQAPRAPKVPHMLKPYLSNSRYPANQFPPLEHPISAKTEEFQPAKLDLAPVTELEIGPLSKIMLLIGGALVNSTLDLVRKIIEFIKAILAKFGIGMRESVLQKYEHPSQQKLCYEPYIPPAAALPAPSAGEAATEQLIQIHDALQKNDPTLLPDGDGRSEVVEAMEAEHAAGGATSEADPLAALQIALASHKQAEKALKNAQLKKGFIYLDSRPKAWAERDAAVEELEQKKDKFKQWKAANPIFSNLPSGTKSNFLAEIKRLEGLAAAANAAAKVAEAADAEAEKRYKALPESVPSPQIVQAEKTARTSVSMARQSVQNHAQVMINSLVKNPPHFNKIGELSAELTRNFARFQASGEVKKTDFDALVRIQNELKTLQTQERALANASAATPRDADQEQQRG